MRCLFLIGRSIECRARHRLDLVDHFNGQLRATVHQPLHPFSPSQHVAGLSVFDLLGHVAIGLDFGQGLALVRFASGFGCIALRLLSGVHLGAVGLLFGVAFGLLIGGLDSLLAGFHDAVAADLAFTARLALGVLRRLDHPAVHHLIAFLHAARADLEAGVLEWFGLCAFGWLLGGLGCLGLLNSLLGIVGQNALWHRVSAVGLRVEQKNLLHGPFLCLPDVRIALGNEVINVCLDRRFSVLALHSERSFVGLPLGHFGAFSGFLGFVGGRRFCLGCLALLHVGAHLIL